MRVLLLAAAREVAGSCLFAAAVVSAQISNFHHPSEQLHSLLN
jgi:hypothetical protein